MIEIVNRDCLDVMKNIPDNIIDCIITDPPYKTITGGKGKTLEKFRVGGILFDNNNFGWKIDYKTFHPKWIKECYRVLKDQGHCYIMTNTLEMETLLRITRETGFKLHNILIWNKGNKVVNRWYMKQVEYILFLRKGKAVPIHNKGYSNLLDVPNVRNKKHPTQKPVELMKILIGNSTKESEFVLDPFVGCGSTAIACDELNRSCLGIELNTDYFSIALERIKNKEKGDKNGKNI